ncbi:type II secretion system F family protein [Amycolatopsis sp. QT-25]|uniref:type II secretion system F family protein n=1 Tax=Amycolatopsis sp. QT-25 TaxID=3034022 RepID=UPI0023EDF2E9|nr:type II secretion system F family protein [Amycolatopsis sp. QT-25]WET79153.1 type II secretion system F family protein [Amycolatopsis sp. QT-25]
MLTGTALILLGGAVFSWPHVTARPIARTSRLLTWLRERPPRERGVSELLRSAATLDLLAACLAGGLPVPVALEAVVPAASAETAAALRSVAARLAVGIGPAEAWAPIRDRPGLTELSVAAVRTARAGTALATHAKDLARRLRESLSAEAEERAERAGVLLAAPIGLCFLPAFLCLGVLPVVLGLAGRLGGVI